ncbi:SDR family NAD(P)-dependent oxidoreductase [Micromonospora trifolii]|uniref:SDR family NAD(P)-dependent oxidoreductase n=1 Tax=Micromonospora trifolii TaxID=2911208 RepID=UPI003CF8B293
MGSLGGRRMIVVGGSTGIGRGIADAWAAAGADVVVCSRHRPADAGHLSWERLDLTAPKHARERLAGLATGGVDVVCFSAVYYGEARAYFSKVAEGEWRRQLEVNVTGLWLTLGAFLPALREAGPGLFVGVSSEVAFNAGPGRSGYAASKAAAKVLLDSLGQEEDSVRVVQLLPAGMVDTPGIRRRRPADFDYSSYAQPSSFARVATELAVTAGDGQHGESLVVDANGDWGSTNARSAVSQSRALT